MNTPVNSISAFPTKGHFGEGWDVAPQDGMTLRDWFAGQALCGLMMFETTQGKWDEFAKGAYDCADAMLAEREKPNKPTP